MLQSIFTNVIEITLTISAVIVILLLLIPLFKKSYYSKWRYFIWLVLALRLIIPFNITLPEAPVKITPPTQVITYTVERPANDYSQKYVPVNTIGLDEYKVMPVLTLTDVLAIIWIFGIFVFLSYEIFSYMYFKRSVKRWSTNIKSPDILSSWNEIKGTRNIAIKLCKKVSSPMMFGFLKPTLLLPKENYTEDDLYAILKHEMTHYKRHDLWYKLILLLANAVHWFNPFVYLMVKSANRDIEISCDDEVVKNEDLLFRKAYSETILSVIYNEKMYKTSLSTYFQGGKKTMKERFSNILDMKNKRKGVLAFILITLIAVSASVFVACHNGDNKEKTNEIHTNKAQTNKTGIILNNTDLFFNTKDKRLVGKVNKNDLAYIIKEDGDFYYVQMPVMDIPPIEGYISKTQVSFDERLFNSSNYGVIKDAVVYLFPNQKDVYQEKATSIIIIERRQGEWAKCTLTGGDSDKWVKLKDITYNLQYYKDSNNIMSFENESDFPEQYRTQFSNYMADLFTNEYSPYYQIKGFEVSNLRFTENADNIEAAFLFKMIVQNYYKDPDTVGYIKQAKENGSKWYKQLYDEYNQPKESNYDLKFTAQVKNGGIDVNSIELFENVHPKGVEYVPMKVPFVEKD